MSPQPAGAGGEGAGAQTGAAARAKPKGRNNVNVPQEIVTPTRRDMHTPNPTANIDWVPVSDYNSRSNLTQTRKPINVHPENNEFMDIDSTSTSEATYRFVPVRPQPRTLILRQMENQDDSSQATSLGAHGSHTNHAAVMIVNPTTPSLPKTKTTRQLGEDTTSSCPIDSTHVEHRLGQIQEYIRVTASLVDSMRNSEELEQNNDVDELLQTLNNLRDSEAKLTTMLNATVKTENEIERITNHLSELAQNIESAEKDLAEQSENKLDQIENPVIDEFVPVLITDVTDLNKEMIRSSSAQSGGSGYSENDLWQSEMDASQSHSGAELMDQKYILKCQDIPVCRSSSRGRDLSEGSDFRDVSERKSSVSSVKPDLQELDMLRDLQIRRQHLENRVLKIQNLQAASSSLVETVASGQMSSEISDANKNSHGNIGLEITENGTAEDDIGVRTLRNKMAAVNVVKVELERLNNMLRTVDSIQSNFGLNTTSDDDNSCDSGSHTAIENHNRKRTDQNRLSDSSFNNIPSFKSDSPLSSKSNQSINIGKNRNTSQSLPKLQNVVSSGSNKCVNVYDQRDICAELATIQHLTQQMKHEAPEINDVRQSLNDAFISGVNNYSALSSNNADEKKKTNSSSKTNSYAYPASLGPLERKQQALKIELEAKKKQLERLMSKEVNHRTNQQSACPDSNVSVRSVGSICDRDNGSHGLATASPLPNLSSQNNSMRPAEIDPYTGLIRTEVVDYSSDQDEDNTYSPSSNTQMNVNQLNSTHKLPSICSSPVNFKVSDYNDSQSSMDNIIHNKHTHGNIFTSTSCGKHRNKESIHIKNPVQEIPVHESLQEQRTTKDIFLNQRVISEPVQESKSLPETEHDPNILPMPQSFKRFSKTPANRNSTLPQMTMRDNNILVNGHADITETCSQLDSQSSNEDQELTDVPNPMPPMSLRHTTLKDEQVAESENLDQESQQWYNPHMESQVTMWWHNKANQLQQQLEMTSNLCQSLLQDRRPSQTSPSTLNSVPQTFGNTNLLMPNHPGSVLLPYGFGNLGNGGNMTEQLSGSWWMVMQQQQLALQQQQLAAQQQQLAANSWANNQCMQNILSQHREISSLQSTINSLEEKIHTLNVNTTRSHCSPSSNNHIDRGNPAISRAQLHPWNVSTQLPVNQPDTVQTNGSSLIYINRQNSNNDRNSSTKKPPSVPPYPMDHTNSNIPLNLYPPPFTNEHMNSHVGMAAMAPNNLSMANQSDMLFNNASPSIQLHPNILNHHNNMNLINIHGPNQSLEGQNTALNNQVPPGNRANNYWDNFRSYSRQNLLSGNNKINSESSLQTHSPLPLSERSHNSLHSGQSGLPPTLLSVTTPKQNICNQLGNGVFNHINNNPNMQINCPTGNVRGRRNLCNESNFNAPPDVLNINQNVDTAPNNGLINPEENNQIINTVNRNIYPSIESLAITQPSSNQSRSVGAHKRKSSSKLPAKNCDNCSTESTHDKNVHSTLEQNKTLPNLPSTSSTIGQKSTSKLFDLLRDNIYAEVFALINVNESRPHFLIQLFRDLQQISSDTLRQRTLQSIHDLVTRYLASIEMDSNHKNNQQVTSTSKEQEQPAHSTTNEVGIFTLDNNNDIIKFISTHNSDIFNDGLYKTLKELIFSIVEDSVDQNQLDQYLFDNLKRYSGCKLMDISNDLVMILSRISINKKDSLLEYDNSGNVGNSDEVKVNNESTLENACGGSEPIHHCTYNTPNLPSFSTDTKYQATCSHTNSSELKIDLIDNVETCNGDLAEADQSRHGDDMNANSVASGFDTSLPDIVDMDEQTSTEAEAEWLRMGNSSKVETENSNGYKIDTN